MKKRIFSFVLALLMVVSTMAEYPLYVKAADPVAIKIDDGRGSGTEDILASTTDAEGGWSYDAETATLTLNGFEGKYIECGQDLNIVLNGTNAITMDAAQEYGILVEGDLTITDTTGPATDSLTITQAGASDSSFPVYAVANSNIKDVYVKGGTLNVNGTNAGTGTVTGILGNVSIQEDANLSVNVAGGSGALFVTAQTSGTVTITSTDLDADSSTINGLFAKGSGKVTISAPVESCAMSKGMVLESAAGDVKITGKVMVLEGSGHEISIASNKKILEADNFIAQHPVSEGVCYLADSEGNVLTECSIVTIAAEQIPVTSVVVDQEELILAIAEKRILTATVMPENATDKTVSFSSSNLAVATVDETTGEITAVAPGEAIITAFSAQDDFSDSCTVYVKEKIPAVQIDGRNIIGFQPYTFYLINGTRITVGAEGVVQLQPDWLGKTITVVKCNKNEKANSDAQSLSVPALIPQDIVVSIVAPVTESTVVAKGDVKLESTAYGSCTDIVWNPVVTGKYASDTVYTASVSLTAGTGLTFQEGTIPVVVGATEVKNVVVSDNKTLLTFDVVFPATMSVPVESVNITSSSITITVGGEAALAWQVLPSNATNRNVIWKSQDETVVTVEEGKITGIKAGKTTVTVTTEQGGFTDICNIIVKEAKPEAQLDGLYLIGLIPEGTYTIGGVAYTADEEGKILIEEAWHGTKISIVKTNVDTSLNSAAQELEIRYLTENSIELGMIAPAAGMRPMTLEEIVVPEDIHMDVTELIWNPSLRGDVFEGGYSYCAYVMLKAHEGYKFPEDFSASVTDDIASQITISRYNSTELRVNVRFPVTGTMPADKLWAINIADVTYTGKPIKPAVTVYSGTKELVLGKDYSVTYKNNTNAADKDDPKKAPTITGKGNYSGKVIKTFTIKKVNLSDYNYYNVIRGPFEVEPVYMKTPSRKTYGRPKIKFNGKNLSSNEYTLEYPSTAETAYHANGTHIIKVVAKDKNFTGSFNVEQVIAPTLIKSATIKVQPTIEYDAGRQVKPKVTVTYKNVPLILNTDYTLRYENNKEIGTGTAIITGKGAYTGVVKKTFKVTGVKLTPKMVTQMTKTKVYDGKKLNLYADIDFVIKNGETILKPNTDYVISYPAERTKVGNVKVTFTGKNKYTGSVTITVRILPKDIEGMVATVGDQFYVKGGVKPVPYLSGLQIGKDFTVSYRNNTKVAQKDGKNPPIVIITGKGNYKGKITIPFTIVQSYMSYTKPTAKNVLYKDKDNNYKTAITVTDSDGRKLAAGKDYNKNIEYEIYNPSTRKYEAVTGKRVTPYNDENIKMRAKLTPVADGPYARNMNPVYVEYELYRMDISKATIEKIPSYTYTGSAITPKPIVTYKVDRTTTITLVEGTDYTVSYDKNVVKGTANVVITGIGSYGGTKKTTFKIAPQPFKWASEDPMKMLALEALGVMKEAQGMVQ